MFASNRFAIACLCALAVFSVWPSGPGPASAQEAGVKKPWFDSGGVPIHFTVDGPEPGEPVVLLHGFASSIEAQWTPVIEALKKDYRVIAMDLRGCGASGKPHDPKRYGIELMHDVRRLLDHLKVEKAHVVAYSMSAGTGLLMAVHHPGRVLSLTCGGAGVVSFGSNTPPADAADPDALPRNPLLDDLAAALDQGSIGPLTIRLTPKGQPEPTPEAIKAHDKVLLSVNDAKALAALIRGAGRKDTRITAKEIQGIKAPTLAVIGADDPLQFGVDMLKALLPKTKVVVIEHAHHLDAYTRPEFVAAIKTFLDAQRQARKD